MKKAVIFSAFIACIILQHTAMAGGGNHGHKYYMKHAKHHKAHKVHRPHGMLDETYR